MALTKIPGELFSVGDLDISDVGTISLDAIQGDADSNTSITFSGSDVITIATGGSNRLTIGDGALSPVTDNQIDLGTSSLEFKDAYFDGTVTSDAFVGPLTGNVTGTADVATVATTVTITDNENTNETNAIVFTAGGDVDGGNIGLESDGDLTYNPSSGTLTATTFVGALTGNVTGNASGTAATVTGAAQSNITSLGTLTTLTVDNVIVNGTTIGHTDDTDLMTVADGVLTVAGEVDAVSLDISGNVDIDGTLETDNLTVGGAQGSDGQVLTSTGSGVAWETPAGGTALDDITTGDAASTLATSAGNITIDAQGSDTDIIFKGTDGSTDTTFLTLDGSAAGAATFNSTVNGLTLAAGSVATSTSQNFALNTPNSLRINIDSNDSATDQVFVVGHNRTDVGTTSSLLVIQEDGKVGIGTATPNRTLSISTGLAKTSTSTAYPFAIQSNESSGNAQLSFHAIGGASAAVRKWYLQTEESGVANAGQIHVQPNGGTFHSPQGIIFGTETTTAHTLDDYEEGTYTPAFGQSGGGDGGITWTYRYGWYTKVGNIVHCYVDVQHSQMWSWQGSYMYLTLPFTAANDDWFAGVTPWSVSTSFTDTDRNFNGYVGGNTNELRLYKTGTGNNGSNAVINWNQVGRISFSVTYHTAT